MYYYFYLKFEESLFSQRKVFVFKIIIFYLEAYLLAAFPIQNSDIFSSKLIISTLEALERTDQALLLIVQHFVFRGPLTLVATNYCLFNYLLLLLAIPLASSLSHLPFQVRHLQTVPGWC